MVTSCMMCCDNSRTNVGITSHSLNGLKAHSAWWNPCLTLLRWPRPWGWIGLGHRAKPNSIVLLKEQNNKMTLGMTCCCTHSGVWVHSTTGRETFSYSVWKLTQRCTAGKYAENERFRNIHSEMRSIHQIPPSFLRSSLSEPGTHPFH